MPWVQDQPRARHHLGLSLSSPRAGPGLCSRQRRSPPNLLQLTPGTLPGLLLCPHPRERGKRDTRAPSRGTPLSWGAWGREVRFEGGNKGTLFSFFFFNVLFTGLSFRCSQPPYLQESVQRKRLKSKYFSSRVLFGEGSNCSFVENTGCLKTVETIVLLKAKMRWLSATQRLLRGFLQTPPLSLASLVRRSRGGPPCGRTADLGRRCGGNTEVP